MASSLSVMIAFAVGSLALLSGCAGQPAEDGSLLPDTIGGWTGGEISEYAGDELFTYIDGGAEIFHEHGFSRVDVREYARGDETVSVELYTMTGSAYGIYSYARSQSGEPLAIGSGGTLAEYYLHFWSGPHLVAVTSHTGGAGARSSILEIAEGVASNAPAEGEVPKLMERLPVKGCVAGSEIYIAGPIGLNNAVPIAAGLFQGFAEGATETCGEIRLLVLAWPNAAAAESAFDRAKTRALQDDGLKIDAAAGGSLSLRFEEDGYAAAVRTGRLVRFAEDHGAAPDLDAVFPTTGWEVDHE